MLTAEQKRQRTGIVNPYQITGMYERALGIPRPLPYVVYRKSDSGRGGTSAAWQVHRGNFVTDDSPEGTRPTLDHGRKTFRVDGREDRQTKLTEALDWASARYGVTGWTKGPTWVGAPEVWFPTPVVDWLAVRVGS